MIPIERLIMKWICTTLDIVAKQLLFQHVIENDQDSDEESSLWSYLMKSWFTHLEIKADY